MIDPAGGATPPSGARTIHIVSHGPHCLDGVAAAVAIAHFHEGDRIIPEFAVNTDIDRVLRGVNPTDTTNYELWITDISWREKATDDHLRALGARGVRIYWFDHHRTAINRLQAGTIDVPFTDHVVSEEFAASRLVYEYLSRRLAAEGAERRAFTDLLSLIEMADDNDRWLHRLTGSRTLALIVRALGPDSYDELFHLGADVSYTPRMTVAGRRVEAELERTFQIAEATRTQRRFPDGTTLVTAVCDGHPSEVADRWAQEMPRAVFALYDAKSLTVSLRRSPGCDVDLSQLAERLGGGGHPAAAGCELPAARLALAQAVGEAVAAAMGAGDAEPRA